MNADRRWLGTSAVRVRILLAGFAVLAAGCLLLGLGSRSRVSTLPAGPASIAQSLATAPATESSTARARALFAGLPLAFEPNQGQANLDPSDRRAQFLSRGSGYSLILGSQGAILNLTSARRSESLQMKLAGANPNTTISATGPLPGRSNYLLGNNPANWRHDIPQFSRVRYENIYPGIDLVFYGDQGRLEYDFQIAPGADPALAELEFDGATPQLRNGALTLETANGAITFDAPSIYQEISGHRVPVAGRFVERASGRIGFSVGDYDRSRELVIDPVLSFSSYFGGSGDETSNFITVDVSGYIYLAGSTTSPNLPAVGVLQTTLNGAQNIYVAKITPPLGSNNPVLDYVTYLGGDGVDVPVGVEVDSAGNPFVAGTTSSTNFPTTATTAYQTAPEVAGQHVFVSALDASTGVAASLLYSSYLAGNGTDLATGMAIDSRGYIYVTGTTTSDDTATTDVQFPASTLPQALPYQSTPRAPIQFFVTKVNTNAPRTGSISYSTYFGGGDFATTDPIAVGGGIAVDTNGNIYFSGTTNFIYTGCQGCQTTDFPILNAYQPCLNQAPPITIINPPTCTDSTANSDAFVAKLNPNAVQGSQLIWSTYAGGTGTDSSTGVAVDSGAANVYITGTTNSADFTPLSTFAAFQRCLDTPVNPAAGTACPAVTAPAPTDGFVARLSNPVATTTTTNVALTYFSYIGGSANDASNAITVDSANGALITGWTQSADFPVFPFPNAIQSIIGGAQDAFVARLNTAAVVGQSAVASWANFFGGTGSENGTGIAIDNNQTVYFSGNTNSTDLQLDKTLESYNGGNDAFVVQLGTAASLQVIGQLTLGTNQQYIYAGNQATFAYTITNNGPDLANTITFTDDISTAQTGIAVTFISASASAGSCTSSSSNSSIVCSIGALQSGSTATVTVVLTPTASTDGSATRFNGGKVTVTAGNNITPAQTSVSANMSDFSIQASPNNFTVAAAGDPATYQVQLFPHPVYVPAVALTCSGLPAGATCGFANASITLQGSPGATVLTISTTARPITVPTASLTHRAFYAIFLLPAMALVGFGAAGKRRRVAVITTLCFVFALLVLQPACSQKAQQTPVSGTPAGTYPITIAATSGNDTKNASVTLVVP